MIYNDSYFLLFTLLNPHMDHKDHKEFQLPVVFLLDFQFTIFFNLVQNAKSCQHNRRVIYSIYITGFSI